MSTINGLDLIFPKRPRGWRKQHESMMRRGKINLRGLKKWMKYNPGRCTRISLHEVKQKAKNTYIPWYKRPIPVLPDVSNFPVKQSPRPNSLQSKPAPVIITGANIAQTNKPRNCLRCGKKFISTWAGNRICNQCSTLKNTSTREYGHSARTYRPRKSQAETS